MSGCMTCGGYGMHHDPIAHDAEPREIGGLLISGGIWISDEDDEVDDYREDEAHDALHPWWFAGCADCDERADAKEAVTPPATIAT